MYHDLKTNLENWCVAHYNGNRGPESFNRWPMYMLAHDNGVRVTWAEEEEEDDDDARSNMNKVLLFE